MTTSVKTTHDPIIEEARNLCKRGWTTRGARFAAHRRLIRMHWASLGSIAIASLYLLAISIVTVIIPFSLGEQRWIGSAAIISSVAILILSIYEAGKSYELKAERLHDCGLALSALCHKLDLFIASNGDGGHDKLGELIAEYEQILRTHKENHDPVDYNLFRADNSGEFDFNRWQRQKAYVRWTFRTYSRFVIIVVLPPCAALLMFAFG